MTTPRGDRERREWMEDCFVEYYGLPPRRWSRAPGRVDLMGSHTDYNQGWVLTMAIDRDTWIAGRARPDGLLRVRSLNVEGEAIFQLGALKRNESLLWPNYVAGVAWALMDAGHELSGCDLLAHTTVPLSSGLSSSAALEMATAVIFELLCGVGLDPVRRALLGQRAENRFVGVNCGILDQYTSSVGENGSALALDCRALESVMASIAPSIGVVICNTRAKRELAGSQYGIRRAQCEEAVRVLSSALPGITALRDVGVDQFEKFESMLPPVVARRARFIVEENARVLALAEALEQDDRAAIGALTAASFAGARDLYEISVPEMESMFGAMRGARGVVGARQAGAGFGGCMVAFVDCTQVEAFAEDVAAAYEDATGITPRIYHRCAGAGCGRTNGIVIGERRCKLSVAEPVTQ